MKNIYEELDDCYAGFTNKGNVFIFDKEDINKICKYYWKTGSRGKIYTIINNKKVWLPNYITGYKVCYNKEWIRDYRKKNLDNHKNNGKVNVNGYVQIYLPTHHLANKTGMVYEHIIKAEELLGRKLNREEVVHHIDKVRNNNSYDNLMVFKTKADHAAFHQGCEIIKEGDVYISSNKNKCKICGSKINYGSTYCIDCYQKELERKEKEKYNNNFRNELKDKIRNKSFVQIGKDYNVSDNTIRKWCKKMNLPFKSTEIKNYTDIEWNNI